MKEEKKKYVYALVIQTGRVTTVRAVFEDEEKAKKAYSLCKEQAEKIGDDTIVVLEMAEFVDR